MRNSTLAICMVALFAVMAISVGGVAAQANQEKGDYKTKSGIIKNIVITVEAETSDGRVLKMQSKPSSDIKFALGSARAALVNSFAFGGNFPEPMAAIFQCGGDAEKSDGTCDDVKGKCATMGLTFGCNKTEEGACTNGSC